MNRRKAFQYSVILFAALALVVTQTSNARAHSGHKHEDAEPQISLPDVLAKVEGIDIKKDAIWQEFKNTVSLYGSKGIPLTIDQEKTAAKKLVDKEIDRTLLLKRAKELSIQIAPEMVEKKFQAVKAKFASNEEFAKKLTQRNLSADQFKEELKSDLVMEQIIQKEIEPKIQIDRQKIKEYYEENTASFKTPETVRASVILVKVAPNAGAEEDKRARDKIEQVLAQIKIGSNFADLAKKFSQDSLASRGGDLGFFHAKQILPDFSDRAFKIKTGEVSEIFRTVHGYHILKVTDRKPASSVSLEDASEKIKELLKSEKIAQQVDLYTEELRKKADIKVYF